MGVRNFDDLKARSEPDEAGCWVWTRARDKDGYARLYFQGRNWAAAHRVAWELTRGPIPAGLTIDHLCFNRACINPEHLRLLTNYENAINTIRTLRTVCGRGHPMIEENIWRTPGTLRRRCKLCTRFTERRLRESRRAAEQGTR
jgi:hypothetical protein